MTSTLRFAGGLSMIAGLIIGITEYVQANNHPLLEATLLTVVLWALSGALASLTWFALAKILERQDENDRNIRTLYTAITRMREEQKPKPQPTAHAPQIPSHIPDRQNTP